MRFAHFWKDLVFMKLNRKHVLIINSLIENGGVGTYTLNLAKGLKKNGNLVTGMLTHGKGSLYSEYSDVVDKIQVLESRKTIYRYFLLLYYSWKIRPDYIIINFNGTSHALLPFFPAARVISIIHSPQTDFYRISKTNHRFVSAWVAPSPRVASEFVNYSKVPQSSSRVHVIAHGVDVTKGLLETRDKKEFNLIFIGALYQHKGIHLLPTILSRLLLDCPNVTLTIVGTGPEESWLNDSFDNRLADKVTLTGHLAHPELKRLLSKMDVLLFPTYLEAFGLVIAESMAQGVVPVVSHLPGITDFIVDDGVTGFLVQPDHIDGFVDAIRKLYYKRGLLSDMSQRCVGVARDRFSHERMITAYTQLFEGLDIENKS